jgi:amino acid transporter
MLVDSSSADEKSPRVSNEKKQKGDKEDVENGEAGLDRAMTSRHLQFIAIGGTIGTGLFLGVGPALVKAGPVSLLVAFAFMGSVVYAVMVSLGEMAAYIPIAGSFTSYAARFVDPTLGFAMGWLYWFSWSITFALELVAAGIIIQYWDQDLSIAIWISIFWALFTALNFVPVRIFGEIEMWFSMIKVVTIIGFIIFSICVNAGVGDEGYIGFKYWKDPGVTNTYMDIDGPTGKFVGFWAVLVTAGFSYQGTELVGVGAGETANPRKAIPQAIRWTFWGIFSLFMATVFFVGINVPSNDPNLDSGAQDASASPLVVVATRAGVKVLPDIINAVLLSAILTAANSNVYSSSRIMVALAEDGLAPAFMKRTNKYGTPYFAVASCSVMGLIAYINLSSSGAEVFNWLLNVSSTSCFITWVLINVCHIRFQKIMRVQGIPRSELPYLAPLQPYLSYYGAFFVALITVTCGFTAFIDWSVADFFSNYISLMLFAVLYIGHKLICRTKVVPLAEVDLSKGREVM